MASIGLQTWGSRGDVQPFLALAAQLAARGHDVTLAMTTNRDASYVAPAGVTIERVGEEPTQEEGGALIDQMTALGNPLAQARLVLREGFLPNADAMTQAAEALAGSCDVLVRHHFLYMTQTAAMMANVPELSVFLTPDLLPTRTRPPTGMPNLGPMQGFGWWMMKRMVGGVFLPPARASRAAHGLPEPTDLLRDVWGSATGNLIAVSPSLVERPSDWPSTNHMTGFWRGPTTVQDEIGPELEAFLGAGPAPLYASFGSMTPVDEEGAKGLAALLLGAAQEVGRRLVLELPVRAHLPTGEQVLCVERSPHARVFPRVEAVIHHGGAGTTQTAIAAGAPSLVVPHLADQFFWGAQVDRLGVGSVTRARAKVTPKELVRGLRRVLEGVPQAQRGSELRNALEQERGPERAARVIEAALPGGAPRPS